jgi:hypothetical protein
MGVDLEAIKKKIAELNGQRKMSDIQMWKPGVGEHKVRIVPWKDLTDGDVFKTLHFYYLGNERGMLAPKQFGKPDPISELQQKLYKSGKQGDKDLAKMLHAKPRSYAAVIVRGEESKGVQVWSFGKGVHARLLSFFVDDEIGDITDVSNGFDIKVTVTQQPGKQFQDTTLDPARRPSKLSDDPELAKKWTENMPNVDDMWKQKTYQEVETTLQNWLNGGSTSTEQSQSQGTEKTNGKTDDLDKLVDEVKSASKAEKAPSKKVSKKVEDELEESGSKPAKKSDLDAAFEELMNDE